jgi:tRNA 2-thiouridine synthesizing protein D
MKFAITVFSPPYSPSSRRALRFCEAALAGSHEIVRLFFYQDGVYNASGAIVTSQDETNLGHEWTRFIESHSLDAVVCIAAALKRGALDETEARRYQRPGGGVVSVPWALSGLGQLHEAAQQADRLITFGGP